MFKFKVTHKKLLLVTEKEKLQIFLPWDILVSSQMANGCEFTDGQFIKNTYRWIFLMKFTTAYQKMLETLTASELMLILEITKYIHFELTLEHVTFDLN